MKCAEAKRSLRARLSGAEYFHCPLLRDEKNVRLAKRHDALSLRKLREKGVKAEELLEKFAEEVDLG
jgi:glutamyl/glutaminyl-tRNA synthetase